MSFIVNFEKKKKIVDTTYQMAKDNWTQRAEEKCDKKIQINKYQCI